MPVTKHGIFSVARTIVCGANYFVNVSDFRNTGGPSIFNGVAPFSTSWHTIVNEYSAEDRRLVYRFLNGETIQIENNWVELVVPGSSWTDDQLLNYLVYRNSNFGLLQSLMSQEVRANVVPGSFKLVRKFTGRNKIWGSYRKFEIAFSTCLRLMNAVSDFTREELENHFWPVKDNSPRHQLDEWRIAKAIASDVDGLYYSKTRLFLAKAPTTDEEYDRIVISELKAYDGCYLRNLFKFCSDFGPTKECRSTLAEGAKKFKLVADYQEGRITDFFGDLSKSGWSSVGVRIPRTDERPWCFVNNVRKGTAACREEMSLWQQKGEAESVRIKFGCFEIDIKANERTSNRYARYLVYDNHMKMSYATQCLTSKESLPILTEHLETLCNMLEHLANFVEQLLAGTRNIQVMNENLGKRIVEGVRLSPADFLDHEMPPVKILAQHSLVG